MSVVAFILHYMTRQLALIDTTPRTWKLDSHTCELGLQQVQEARAILERVRLQKVQSQESAASAAAGLNHASSAESRSEPSESTPPSLAPESTPAPAASTLFPSESTAQLNPTTSEQVAA